MALLCSFRAARLDDLPRLVAEQVSSASKQSGLIIGSVMWSNSSAARTSARELALEFPDWIERLGDDHTIDLGVLGEISETALTLTSKSRCSKTGFRAPSFPAATFSS